MGRDEDEQAVHVLHVRPGEPLELPLSPYVSTYLAQFGTRKPPAARPSRQRGRTGSRSRSRQRTASAGFGGDRSPSPETPALDAADPDPDAESEDQREALPFARVVHAGAAALPVGTAAIAPFRNDGMRFNEWPAAAPAIGERDASPVGRTGVTAAVKGLREQLRVPSPRLELPSIAGDESGVSRAKPKRTKAAAVPQPATESGRHSAPPGELHYAPPSSLGDAYLPIDLWNNVVARKVDLDPLPHFQRGSASFNAMARPFNRLRTRQYMSTSLRPMIEKVPKERVPVEPREASPREKLAYAALFEEGREAAAQATRPDAPPSRLEASLLKKALETMTNNIKNEKGEEPRHLARQAAIRGQIEQVSTKLEPELYVLDMIMSEVVKQTNLACRERGSVLESIRLRFLEAFSTASLCISRACSDMDHIAEESEMVAGKMAPLQQLNEELSGKVEALEHANAGLHSKVDELTETLESLRRSYQVAIDEDQEGTSLKEQQANQLIKEANSMREMLQGKLRVLNAQLSQQDANKEVMHLQIQQLEDRVRRDAEKLEFLGQTVAEYKIRLAWTRVLAWARRTKKETADAETQDGEGLPEVSSISRLPSTVRPSTRGSETFGRTLSKDEERARVVTKESLKGQVIAYSAFWAGVVMQAEQMDFNLRPHLQMTKKELLELIAKTYSEKILAGCPMDECTCVVLQVFAFSVQALAPVRQRACRVCMPVGVSVSRAELMDVQITHTDNTACLACVCQTCIISGSFPKMHTNTDDIDERAKMSRQTLPEFLFDYYLNLFGEPQLAEEALVIIVANVRTYDTTSPRAWMFSRFLRFLCIYECVRVRACACTCDCPCVFACTRVQGCQGVHVVEIALESSTYEHLLAINVHRLQLQSRWTTAPNRSTHHIPSKSGADSKRPDSSPSQLRRLKRKRHTESTRTRTCTHLDLPPSLSLFLTHTHTYTRLI